ncbi:RloB family protein [Agrobacterium vitis]|uniref:RloB family protein n=1 Tax=Agrobacterium vitis TaxID=373 RepID=UPI0018D23A0E|nr:RloB family protein [Agrobacterium vitis]
MGNDQLFKKRKAATLKSLQRREVGRKPLKRILIVGEGDTEERYFKAFVADLKLDGVEVDVRSDAGFAPRSIVKFAEKKARDAGPPENGGYSQIFCVFDRDSHESYQAAISKTRDLNKSSSFPSKIESITSIPCIEFWFVLHHKYCRIPFAATGDKSVGDAVKAYLRKINGFEDYIEAISQDHLKTLISLTDTAFANAKLAEQDAKETGEFNPTTNVGLVVEYLREAKRLAEIEADKSR